LSVWAFEQDPENNHSSRCSIPNLCSFISGTFTPARQLPLEVFVKSSRNLSACVTDQAAEASGCSRPPCREALRSWLSGRSETFKVVEERPLTHDSGAKLVVHSLADEVQIVGAFHSICNGRCIFAAVGKDHELSSIAFWQGVKEFLGQELAELRETGPKPAHRGFLVSAARVVTSARGAQGRQSKVPILV